MNRIAPTQVLSDQASSGSPAELPDKVRHRLPDEGPQSSHPTRDDIAALPPYARLPLHNVHTVQSTEDEDFAMARMAESGVVGFDTESKPVFKPGQASDGPHIVQLATLDHAFIFQVGLVGMSGALRECLESPHLLKVGFGLNSDRGPLHRKFGINLANTVDVSRKFKALGYRQAVGAKAAVAIALGMRLQKSKKTTTSNWANTRLTPEQLQYAADDAHAALVVFLAMGCPSEIHAP
jgi:3'-5' exonuclease